MRKNRKDQAARLLLHKITQAIAALTGRDFLLAGGLRTTLIDLQHSLQNGYVVYPEEYADTQQNEPYFRSDLRLSLRWNRPRLTSTLSLHIQNITNRFNTYGHWFDSENGEVITTRQTGLIPVLNYKVEF